VTIDLLYHSLSLQQFKINLFSVSVSEISDLAKQNQWNTPGRIGKDFFLLKQRGANKQKALTC